MSKPFEWTEEYSVNVAEIDEQHKRFIGICNELLAAAGNPDLTRKDALLIVAKLGDYASYHLGTEEEKFEATHYPEAAAHIVAHQGFRRKIKELVDQVRDVDADLTKSVIDVGMFAGEWLFNHILLIDKRYSKYFNEHGVK